MAQSPSGLPDSDSPETARAGVHAMLRLRKHWHLTRDQLARLLGIPSGSTIDDWTIQVPEALAPDVLNRMGYMLAIYYALEQTRGGERSAEWLRAPNSGSPFFGRSPLDYMLDGRMVNLVETHRCLQRVATGGF